MKHGRVEPRLGGIPLPTAKSHQVEAGEPGAVGELAPQGAKLLGIGKLAGLEHQQERPFFQADVARVAQRRSDRVEVRGVVLRARVGLLDQHPFGRSVPHARPAGVGPAQTEREVRLSARQHLLERPLQYALAPNQ